jgi:hypothetical protein
MIKKALRIENLLMALGAGLAFQLAFKLTGLLDGYFAYAQGISLLFLPAGVKLLFILVGRIPALVGLTVLAAYAAVGEWAGYPIWMPISFAIVAQANYYLAVYWLVRLLEINKHLTNMRYWHIVVMSLLVSVVNGVVHNVVYLAEEVNLPEDFLSHTAAMTLGDFMGCFVVVGLFQLVANLLGNREKVAEY